MPLLKQKFSYYSRDLKTAIIQVLTNNGELTKTDLSARLRRKGGARKMNEVLIALEEEGIISARQIPTATKCTTLIRLTDQINNM